MFVFGFRQNGIGLEEAKSGTKIAENLDVVSLGVVLSNLSSKAGREEKRPCLQLSS